MLIKLTPYIVYIIGHYQNYTNIFCKKPFFLSFNNSTLYDCFSIKLSISLKKSPIFSCSSTLGNIISKSNKVFSCIILFPLPVEKSSFFLYLFFFFICCIQLLIENVSFFL